MTPKLSRLRAMLSASLLLLLMGNLPHCEGRPATLTCDSPSIVVDAGSCVELENPCGDHQYVRLDSLRLCHEPPGLFIQTQNSPRKRFLCAGNNIEALDDVPVEFFYATQGSTGFGELRVSSSGVGALAVEATATPTAIPAGGSSQLNAVASGGTPPYAYTWSPAAGLSDTTIANPVASPTVSMHYTVVVSDSNGLLAGDTVIVNVGIDAGASANPQTVAAGQSSNLSVQVTGGTPPYTFAWTPPDTLSAPNVGSPVATPLVTTTYTVRVTDFLGNLAVASVTVNVTLAAVATANPASITAGQASQLDVNVMGGAAPFVFDWSPPATLNDPELRNPVATPTTTTDYNVIVTDSAGAQAASSVRVTVAAGALTACFTVQVLGPFAIQVDGSCSTGSIVEYRWWPHFLGGNQQPSFTEADPVPPVFLHELPGPDTIRLEVRDSSGATAVTTQVVTR